MSEMKDRSEEMVFSSLAIEMSEMRDRREFGFSSYAIEISQMKYRREIDHQNSTDRGSLHYK